jgi:tetratricopeptide (TPR) repeat protein
VGEIDKSRRASEEAFAISERCGDYAVAERAIGHLTVNAQDSLRRDEVVKWSARWLELTVKAGDRRCEQDALGQSTWPLLWSPNFLDALPVLERAAQICRECGLGPQLLVNEMNAAEFAMKLGSFDAAVATFEAAAQTYATVAPFFASHARGGLVRPLVHTGNVKRAIELGGEALASTRETGNVFELEGRLESMAEAEYAADNLRGAIEHLEEAAMIRRGTSPPHAAAHFGALLAAFYAKAGDCGAALEWAAQVPTAEPQRSVGLLWPQRSAWCVAFAYHLCERDAQAKEWLDRAMELYEMHLPYLNGAQRAIFDALPWHRAMLGAKRGDWPAAPWVI